MGTRTTGSVLGKAIARCLSRTDGKGRACLADGIDRSVAEAIADHANQLRAGDPPYAILVASRRALETHTLPTSYMSVDEALRYRVDDRLAIVVGRPDPNTSFERAYRLRLGAGFPDREETGMSLVDLARESVAVIVTDAGVAPQVRWNREIAAERLANCLVDLRSIFRSLRQGSAAWNALWVTHVRDGLDALAGGLEAMLTTAGDADFDRWWEAHTYGAFALPRPANGMSLSANGAKDIGGAVGKALDEWWCSTSQIRESLAHLAVHPETQPAGGPHALNALDWGIFDRELAACDNQMLALARVAHSSGAGASAFTRLSEAQFFSPLDIVPRNRRVILEEVDGSPLSAGGSRANLYLLPVPEVVCGLAETSGSTGLCCARIPLAGRPADADIAASRLDLEASGHFGWVTETRVLDERDGQWWVVLSGRLKWATGSLLGGDPTTLKLQLPSDDPLKSQVPERATCTLLLLMAGTPGAAWVKVAGKGIGMTGHPNDASEGPLVYELEPEQEYQLFAWTARKGQAPRVNGALLPVWHEGSGVCQGLLRPAGEDVLQIGDLIVHFLAPEPEHPSKSPIISAIWCRSAATDDLSPETMLSVRGRYETSVVMHHGEAEWQRASGHWVLVQDDEVGGGEPAPLAGGAFLSPPNSADVWLAQQKFTPPREVVESTQADDFRSAFEGLRLHDRLQLDPSGEQAPLWPSQASWRDLWSPTRDALAIYLSAFTELVRHARAVGDPAGIFWASYPWSISVWSGTECEVVLLSPLHPVRLVWIAAAESILWDANSEVAAALAGTVEGWNLPMIGPRTSSKGRMLAAPIDNGEGQVFLGWSMLAGASIDGAKPLNPSVRAGRFRLPGSSASGLNAGGVDSALRDFRRVNPHVTTLTIDLAAGRTMNRLPEIDEAVLHSAGGWANMQGAGSADAGGIGIRVLDSIKRDGDPPIDSVARFVMDHPDAAVSWTRYTPRAGSPAVCNIRLLQDSGVRLELGTGSARNGLVADAPLRRLEPVPPAVGVGGQVVSEPALGVDCGWHPFLDAVNAIEYADEFPSIAAELDRSLLVDQSADWTVAGEALVGPSALADLVARSGAGSQMLWEWRPPFLSPDVGKRGHSLAVLERRPFVSVVRVPAAFRDQVSGLLGRVAGASLDQGAAGDMLVELGKRGVGLSSLTAIGGTHSAGALGFYLVMRLMNTVAIDDKKLVVLPIDSCEPFLRVLGPEAKAGLTRRADLLVLALGRDSIQLLPIEIKMYGLLAGAEAERLPAPGGAEIANPVEQLAATVSMLMALVDRGDVAFEDPASADAVLWRNGLMALVEAGIRMTPGSTSDAAVLVESISSLVAGRARVLLASPLVCFFSHDARGPQGQNGVAYPDESHPALTMPFGLFAANPGAALREIQSDVPGECVDAWGGLVSWALSASSGAAAAVVPAREAPASEFDAASDDSLTTDPSPPVTPVGPQAAGSSRPIASPGVASGPCDDGVRFAVGKYLSAIGQADAEFWPSSTALTQMNVGVVGDLGTGKTQLLKSILFRLRQETRRCQERPATMLVFDYKVDYQDQEFIDAVDGRVLAPTAIPLNVFALSGPYSQIAAVQVARNFIDVLSKIYSGIGPVQSDNLTTVVTDLFVRKNGRSPTLGEVVDEYRARIGGVDAALAVMNQFVLGGVFSEDASDLLTFDELIADSLLVVALDQLGNDQKMKNALVVMFLNQYYDYMRRQPKSFRTNKAGIQLRTLNSFLMVDEALNIMRYEFQVLQDLMLQGREFGVGTILASQYLSHFRQKGTNYGEPLRSWFIHRVSGVVRQQLLALGITGATDEMAAAIADYAAHEALYVTEGVSGRAIRGFPFYELPR